MNPIRKPFASDPQFPFDLMHRDRKNPRTELPDHYHDRYEIVFVHGGRGTFFIDRTFYDMREGDLFLLPGHTVHRSFPDEADPTVSTAVFFGEDWVRKAALGEAYACLQCFEWAKRCKIYKLELAPPLRTRIEPMLDSLADETSRRAPGYRQAVLLTLHQLLLTLNREIVPGEAVATRESNVGPAWMREALHYIDGHVGEELSLSVLARRAAVTPAHFARLFRQLVGLSVTDYVHAKRIAAAQELLASTDAGIREVAERCGFASLPHFHRTFKRITGLTPAAYKRTRTHSPVPTRGQP